MFVLTRNLQAILPKVHELLKSDDFVEWSGMLELPAEQVDPLVHETSHLMERLDTEFTQLAMDNLSMKKLQIFVKNDYTRFRTHFTITFMGMMSKAKKAQDAAFNTSKLYSRLCANYFLMNLDFKTLQARVSEFFGTELRAIEELRVDADSDLLSPYRVKTLELESDPAKIRDYARKVMENCPASCPDPKLLEQQISEIIKNAVVHGNRSDPTKKITISHEFTEESARLVVEDEGDGFKELEQWNEFNRKRNDVIRKKDFERIMEFAAFRTDHSSPDDGGNSLFAALEYWDSGLVYNDKRNKVAAMKYFI